MSWVVVEEEGEKEKGQRRFWKRKIRKDQAEISRGWRRHHACVGLRMESAESPWVEVEVRWEVSKLRAYPHA